jgi:lysozyme family protein
MADFAKYFPLLLANEGGYVFDPHDPGGETWAGVSRVFNPRWPGWPLIDAHKAQADWPQNCNIYPRNKLATAKLKPDARLATAVQSFYQAQYWDSQHLGAIKNQCIASQLCDIGVNSGTGRVGKIAQYVLASSFGWQGQIDGQLGPLTVAAINAAPAQAYYDALVAARRAFYQYRCGHQEGLQPGLVAFLQGVRVQPDAAMQRYLPAWLGRINAIPFTA